jgi:hypothetical protein
VTALHAVLIAVVGYAIGNIIFAHKLVGVSALSSIPFYTLMVMVGTLSIGKVWAATGHTVTPWNASHLPWLILLGAVLIVADIAFVAAYNLPGASVRLITTSTAILPVVAALLEKLFITKTMPSMRTMCAFALAIFVVWLVAYDPANSPAH